MTPRPYQQTAIYSIFGYFTQNNGNPLVAMPTGTGKSIVIGGFCKQALEMFPSTRIMMLTHVQELVEQNADKLLKMWPTAPLGIHAAGLNQRDTKMPLIYGSVQSAINKIEEFGFRDLLLIDEAHLLSFNAQTRYQQIIGTLKDTNPKLKVVGFTATPYRLDSGRLTDEGGIFTDICHDITTMSEFNKLIAEGYISPLVPKPTKTKIDLSNVGIQSGDFALGDLERAFDQDHITRAALNEIIYWGQDRKRWLIFSSGIQHCEHVAEMLESFGVPTTFVHSKVKERSERIKDFQAGRYRCMVNANMLTTGFDCPAIDLMGILRATLSTSLWVQMLGRGTRPAEGKANCLALDFAGNTPRLGPINDPLIPERREKGERRNARETQGAVRLCSNCETYIHASYTVCPHCGNEFPREIKILPTAGTEELVRSDMPEVETIEVQRVLYYKHEKPERPPMIKVVYVCGYSAYSEYIGLEHPGYMGKKSREWWRQRYYGEAPHTTEEALELTPELKQPKRIRVWVNRQYPEIMGAEF